MIFVDTGAWFATFVPRDSDHSAACTWLDQNTKPLVTSDYIIDELLTLLRIRGEGLRALPAGHALLSEAIARIEWVSQQDVRIGWDYFSQHQDKGWSFTDCVSRAVINRLQIRVAFAFDKHFRQFGDLEVVP
jgi:predicted nucleic acid-binding protein